jgi:epoxyqueuosine reductase
MTQSNEWIKLTLAGSHDAPKNNISMSTPQLLKEKIRDKATALGFSLFGVARAGHADPDGHFASWLQNGHHADLDYLQRRAEERSDPEKFFPGVKSIIALGIFYRWDLELNDETSSAEIQPKEKMTGDVSCYAWGSDYHRVVIKKVRKLREEISLLAPEAKLYGEVDTGPVLEKVWAARAGLGWAAKHSNVLSRNGSWFFLAVIMTDLFLPEDQPSKDFCGTCTRCIDVCPTKAIIAPGVVDARRCISYLTIENKGGIPREMRSEIGRWVFGCDDCQLVCPWNKFDPGATEVKFKPRPNVPRPDLIQMLSMSNEDFTQVFQGTPVARAGLRGMKRNALVVLGNLKDPRAIEAISKVLQLDEDPMIRGHAAWALGQLGAKEALLAAQQNELDPSVQNEITFAQNTPG